MNNNTAERIIAMQTVEIQGPHQSISSRIKVHESSTQVEMRRGRTIINKLFKNLFYIHLVLIFVLVVFLLVRVVISAVGNHFLRPKKWYILVYSSTACAAIIGFSWQAVTSVYPSSSLKAAFSLSPLLTCAYGILLVSIGTPGSLALAVFALVFSVLQALYACWASPRIEHARKILTVSITHCPPKVKTYVILSVVASTLYSSFSMAGIGGTLVTRTTIDPLIIFLILGSLTWTTQIIKNTIQVTVSHVKYMQFTCGIEVDFKAVVRNAAKHSMGDICIGSIIVPVLDVIKGSARGVSLVSGDVDEFMFSCASCCSGVASRIVSYGNRWGFVHVGVYNKGIVQASRDTWEMFRRIGMEKMISSDLTSSFCFLSGVAAGSICALVGGTWALVVLKSHATEVSIYVFLTGYFINTVAMAWIQASIIGYYVAYAENPQSELFDTTIPAYIQELQRSQV